MTKRRTGLVVLGDLLITMAVLVGLFLGYELAVTNVTAQAEQRQLRRTLEQQWSHLPPGAVRPSPLPTPRIGDGLAILRIPRLGRDYVEVVVAGVTFAALASGPGHYPGTAPPGQVGNFVVSGHRTTHGAPFRHLDRLRVGDPIVVETRDRYYVYDVTRRRIVAPAALGVTAPVPERPGVRPTVASLTLTTCYPLFSARQRLVVFARLAATEPKTAGPPAALAG